ncbi:MAG TPA: autotransporter-associated beta strand repeat-containing protein, partial [Candidatus Polarisedimenticolia bacterium]|nr:autotransporter-associated beta strand repeat-containing protein [Candidatus Polarisedimenticolia bacterium]
NGGSGSINPGLPGIAGALTITNGLTESGGVNNQFELGAGSNDVINVIGNLTLSGANNLTLSAFGGGTIPTGVYPLITYTGTLSGGTANFNVTIIGATGIVTNITTSTPPSIGVIVLPPARAPMSLTWKGDGALNNWDGSSSNWVNGVNPFSFLAGDTVTFDDSGAPNTNVNLTITALPVAVTFNGSQPYTLAGPGGIDGATGLTKNGNGSLTLLTTNGYTGPTVVGGGTLEVQDIGIASTPSAIGAANSDPTNLVLSGATFKYSGGSASTDHGITLNGSGAVIDVTNGTTLTVNGTITGAGALSLTDSGTLTLGNANTYTGGTIISNGVLALGSNNANNNGAGGSGVGPTNNPVTFYGGTLQLFGAGANTGNNYNTLYNPLVVPAGQTGTLVMFPRGFPNTGNGAGLNSSLSGSGTLNLVVNYVRDALSGDWSAFTGTIMVTNFSPGGDEMRINNNFGYANATIYLNGTFVMDSSLSANAIIDIGDLGGVSTAIIGAGNSSAANPTWRVGWKNTTDTFAGSISDDGHSSIIKVGTGTWYLAGQNTFTGSTIISNGVIGLTNVGIGDGAITASTNIFINSGAALDVSGRSDDTMFLNFGQVLCGNGTLNGILDTTPGGTVSAGGGVYDNAIGALTVTNHINLGGTTWLKLNRTAVPDSDRLISPAINISGGTLVVTNVGMPLQAGDTFTLFNGPITGTFTLMLPNYYTWDTTQLYVNGTIRVTAANLPKFSADFSAFSSGTITLSASNGLPNGPISVLSTTNIALPLSQWTVVTTGNFDNAGNFSAPVTVDPTTVPRQFFTLLAQ